MDPSQLSTAARGLTAAQLLELCAGKSGANWAALRTAFEENGVDGETLSEYVGSVEALQNFLRDDLELRVPKIVPKQLRKLLGQHGGGSGGGEARGAAAGLPATNRMQADQRVGGGSGNAFMGLISLRVRFTQLVNTQLSASRATHSVKQVSIDVPAVAPPQTVVRCLLDRLDLHLSTSVVLTHAGLQLQGDRDVNWATMSIVHAAQTPQDSPLTLDNLDTHPVMAARVYTDDNERAPRERSENVPKGWCLDIEDDRDRRNILGRGSHGEVYGGVSIFAGRRIRSAVKKFFVIKDPKLYGVRDANDLVQWTKREVLPEINTLLSLAHPNVVRLRCVACAMLFGRAFPAYVAMDYCSEGTLEQWIEQRRLTDSLLPVFLSDFVSAMIYLHVEKRVIHRDLKPANIFVRRDGNRDGRPALVVGDVGLAKELKNTMAKASVAGTPMYFAPELAGVVPQCSLASDVFSASLIVLEMLTTICVHVFAANEAEAAARTVFGHQAKAAARAAAVITARETIIAHATERLQHVLVFAFDSPLTLEAVKLLMKACTQLDPARRCSFVDVQLLCKRASQPRAHHNGSQPHAQGAWNPPTAARAATVDGMQPQHQTHKREEIPQARPGREFAQGHRTPESSEPVGFRRTRYEHITGTKYTMWNVRKWRLVSAPVVGKIHKGDVFWVDNEVDGWFHIEKFDGWAKKVFKGTQCLVPVQERQRQGEFSRLRYQYLANSKYSTWNVRAGRQLSATAVGKLRQGEVFWVDNEIDGWLHVEKFNGWASKVFEGNQFLVPVRCPGERVIQRVRYKYLINSKYSTWNVRAGRYFSAAPVGKLRQGELFWVDEELDGWLHVEKFNGWAKKVFEGNQLLVRA